MDKRYKRLGKNTIIVFLGNAGSKIVGLLMLPFYTHFLSKAEYGTSDLINTYTSVLLALVTCCIADSIFIFPKDKREIDKTRYFTSGILFAIFTFAIVCIFVYIARLFVNDVFFYSYIWWVVGLTFGHFLSNYIQQFTRSIDKMIVYSLTGLAYVSFIALFSFLLLPVYQLTGYLTALLLACILSSLFALVASKSYNYIRINEFKLDYLKELLKYGIPLIPNSIMWWLVDGLNRPVMMSNLGMEAIGIYAVANKIPGILTMMFVVFSNAWTISMLEEFGKEDFNLFFNKTMRFLFLVVALGSIFLIMSSKILVGIFASEAFYEAWMYVPILTLGVIFQNLSSLIGGVFAAEKKSKYFFYSSFWGAISSIVCTIVFVKLFGLMGACIAISSSFLCMALVRLKFAWKHINMFSFKYYGINILALIFISTVFIYNKGVLIDLTAMLLSLGVIAIMNIEELKTLILVLKTKNLINK